MAQKHSTVINNYFGIKTPNGQGVVEVQGGSVGREFTTNVSTHQLVSQANLVAYVTSLGFTDVSDVVPDFNLGITIQYTGGTSNTMYFGNDTVELSFTDNAVDRLLISTPTSIKFEFIGRKSTEPQIGHREVVINTPNGAISTVTTLEDLSEWLTAFRLTPQPVLALADGTPSLVKHTIDSSRSRVVGTIPPAPEPEPPMEGGVPEGEGGVGGQGQPNPEPAPITYRVAAVYAAAKGVQVERGRGIITSFTDLQTGDVLRWHIEGAGDVNGVVGHIGSTGIINFLGLNNTVILESQVPTIGTTLTKIV